MGTPLAEPAFDQVLDQILGYLNFSSGSHDPKLYFNVNLVFKALDEIESEKSLLKLVRDTMIGRLDLLSEQNPSFEKSQQAREVIQLTFDRVIADFRAFHSDVLFHQNNEKLF